MQRLSKAHCPQPPDTPQPCLRTATRAPNFRCVCSTATDVARSICRLSLLPQAPTPCAPPPHRPYSLHLYPPSSLWPICQPATCWTSPSSCLRLLQHPPRPILHDVGYDPTTGQFSFRDAHGVISTVHPVAASQSSVPAYAANGTIVPPLSPPVDSSIVLCPEASGA